MNGNKPLPVPDTRRNGKLLVNALIGKVPQGDIRPISTFPVTRLIRQSVCISEVYGAGDGNRTHVRSLGNAGDLGSSSPQLECDTLGSSQNAGNVGFRPRGRWERRSADYGGPGFPPL